MNPAPDSRAGRSERIDTMRGLACLLLVLYHVIGESPETGLRLASGHPLAVFNSVLMYLRMPMFAFLSGLVYARRPFAGTPGVAGGGSSYVGFLKGKFKRLIVPMLIVGTLFFWTQTLTPGVNAHPGSWKTMHLVPVAHFWFLEAMFWIFVVVALLDGWRLLNRAAGLLAAVVLACVVQTLTPGVAVLAVNGALYLLPYFLVGVGVQRFGAGRAGLAAAVLALVAGLAAVAWALHGGMPPPRRESIVALAIGVGACLTMNAAGLQSPRLARIGAYSFGIYMFHVFFTAGCRIALMHAGVEHVAVLTAAGLAAGVLGPIGVERTVRRAWPWGYRWVFGVRGKPADHPGLPGRTPPQNV